MVVVIVIIVVRAIAAKTFDLFRNRVGVNHRSHFAAWGLIIAAGSFGGCFFFSIGLLLAGAACPLLWLFFFGRCLNMGGFCLYLCRCSFSFGSVLRR
ncbi:hypothetical protein D3C87_1562480 [compost metagenome]